MTAETAPLRQKPQDLIDGTTTRVEQDDVYTNNPAEVDIRIYKDGLLIAKCQANGIGAGKLFVAIDPLHYPVNSRLALTFVNPSSHSADSACLTATVIARSLKGIELKLDPHAE